MNLFYKFFSLFLLFSAGIAESFAQATEVAEGYYRIQSQASNRFVIQNGSELGMSSTTTPSTKVNTELWSITKREGGGYLLENLVTQQKARQVNGQRAYMADEVGQTLYLKTENGITTISTDANFSGYTCWHFQTSGSKLVGWTAGGASSWTLVSATVDPNELAKAREVYAQNKDLTDNAATYNATLSKYFEDMACTQMKSSYKGMTDEALRQAMTTDGLPESVMQMALRVKKDQWADQPLANQYEKLFRLASFKAHSDPVKWAARELVQSRTYSLLTNPTGISVAADQTLYLYVGGEIPAGTTLNAELVEGFNSTGTRQLLKPGLNAVYSNADQHLYISYNIDNVDTKLATIPELPIHIEGGVVNGAFHLDRHTNQVWKDLQTLKKQGVGSFMKDEVFRMKSERHCFSFHLAGIEAQEAAGNWNDYDGRYVGLSAVLAQWDTITNRELHVIHADQFYDRYNCVLFASSNSTSNPFATTYGTWYTGAANAGYFSYKHLSRGRENDNGEGVWVIAHEVGHHYQLNFNLAAANESSNNLFSEINVWKNGSNVSRSMPFKQLVTHFNTGTGWEKYGIWERVRFYWQLWLYFEELGHRPNFFRDLSDRLRKEPLNYKEKDANGIEKGADADYLRFARICSDVAQEDLTDFFTMHGFFNIQPGTVTLGYNDAGYDTSYGKPVLNVTQEAIDRTLAHMKQYDKKGAQNLFFIDERIRPIPATYPGVAPGTMRLGTSANATPGDANEVGDVGMYTDFAVNKATAPQPDAVELDGRTVRIAGTDAVGYKVYDETGKLLFLANTNTFTIPENITNFTVKVAGGNGEDVEVIKAGQVLEPYTKPFVDPKFVNTASIAVSSNRLNPEYRYNIQNAYFTNAYAGVNTQRVSAQAEAGQFAFFPAGGPGQYRMVSIQTDGTLKWLVSNGTGSMNNNVSFTTDYNQASVWIVEREFEGSNRFDIMPAYSTNSWNWRTTHETVGIYGKYDAATTWLLVPTNHPTALSHFVAYAQNTEKLVGTGFPTMENPAREALKSAIAAAETALHTTVTETDVTKMSTALSDYRKTRTGIVELEDGKVYRIRHYADGRYLNNASITMGTAPNTTTYPISMSKSTDNASLWVVQKVGEGHYRLASLKADGFLGKQANANFADLAIDPNAAALNLRLGTHFGTYYLRADVGSLSAKIGENMVRTIVGEQNLPASGLEGTDFYFEAVEGANFSVTLTEATNGNFASIFLPFAVTLPADVKAYQAAQPSADVVKVAPLSGNVLPAMTGAILVGEQTGRVVLVPAPYQAPVSSGWNGVLRLTDNSVLDRNAHTYYALRKVDGKAILVQIGTANIPANRAYLCVPNVGGGVQQLTFLFGDDLVTSIVEVPVSETSSVLDLNAPIYDLMGRRVLRPTSGQIYLQGGRKILFR